MKIKRFFAPDIRQAIRKVREELGPDAVILSNARVNGGVEIVTAMDYDESALERYRAADGDGLREAAAERAEADYGAAAAGGAEAHAEHGADQRSAANIWSQEPTLVEMRAELQTLRGLLENQLSGLAWGELGRRHPNRAELLQRLIQFGVQPAQCQDIVAAVGEERDIDRAWHQALAVLANRIPMADHDLLAEGGIVALVGPTGVGKTTTAAKLAARYAIRHGSRQVALVTTDNYRVGAHEQLKIYGRLLDIPVKVADTREALRAALRDLIDRRLVVIDTAGLGQRDRALLEQCALLDVGLPKRTLLLLSTTTRSSGLQEIIQAFGGFAPDGCVLTKVDESTCLGSALSAAIQHRLPIYYTSDGQGVPEDLHVARSYSLVSRGVTIMKKTGAMIQEDLMALTFGKEVANAR